MIISSMFYLQTLLFWHFQFTFLLCHLSFSLAGNVTDHQTLLSIKAALISDPLQLTASWNESTHFCKWVGITCGRKHQRVTEINLSTSKLQGSLSPAIGNLSFLRVILLSNNSFTGRIPDEIGQLSRLQMLWLANNSLSGEIPKNISRCWNLEVIDLADNNLSGGLPIEFQSLSKLQRMYAYRNKLTGEIPPHYGNLSSLFVISLSNNKLQGMIPSSFGGLKHIRYISLYRNNLFGRVPVSIFNLSLIGIDISSNHLEGDLPQNMTYALPTLEFFSVANNSLSGSIPHWVSNAPRIQVFQVNINNFTGEVPNFGGLKYLKFLTLFGNEHLGSEKSSDLIFMEGLTNCTNLQLLQLRNCNFGGILPPYIGNFSSLMQFSIGDNHISGKIPSEIGQLIKLQRVGLENNQLNGIIPNTIGKLQNLYVLSLAGNELSGEIPTSLENLTLLSVLFLSSNNLQGIIPSGLANCRFLITINLDKNNLNGHLPKEIFHSDSQLVGLDLSYNHLSGPLPLEIGALKGLTFLNLSKNLLIGEVPTTFRFLESVETLDLSSNRLTGKIPSFLANLGSLTYLNLSHNDLEGEVPLQGIFRKGNGVFLDGNSKLCGGDLEFHLPKCTKNGMSQKRHLSFRLKTGLSLSLGILAFVLVVFLIWKYWHRRNGRQTSLDNPTTLDAILKVSYKCLHDATNGFAQENLIGSGKFSSVYKGNLDEQGIVVAIKVLKLQVKGAFKSFIAECDALRHIRHRNLVKVVSSCSSIDYKGNDFKAIIYEYMEGGNLETWLHHRDSNDENDQNSERRSLSLLERVNIGIDIASALHYLHVECGTPLVHCDLKPSNVLLDRDLVARVGDFGLAKFLPQEGHVRSTGIKGTFGYVAPEYAMGREFSTFGDVYSYGILLLEMFTRKSPTDNIFSNGINLHEYVKMALPHGVVEITDPTLVYNENDTIFEFLLMIFEIGIACSVDSPKERMNAGIAVNKLHSIRVGLLDRS